MQKSIKDHAVLSEIFNKDEPRVNWHDETLWFVRKKRDQAVQSIPEWEQLREYGSQIKNHTLSNLDQYIIDSWKEAEMVHTLSDSQLIGRMGQPQEVAFLALYFCFGEASFITGYDYQINGVFIKLNN